MESSDELIDDLNMISTQLMESGAEIDTQTAAAAIAVAAETTAPSTEHPSDNMNSNENDAIMDSAATRLSRAVDSIDRAASSSSLAATITLANLNDNSANSSEDKHARTVLNSVFELSDDELGMIDAHLRAKLARNGESLAQQHEQLKAAHEKFKIEYEQRLVEIEAEYNECQTKLASESKNAHLYRGQANENIEKLELLTRQSRHLENEKLTLLSNQERLNIVCQNLEAEKRDLLTLLDKRVKENDRLNEEWKIMNVKQTESEAKLCELTARLEDLSNKESSIAFKEKQYQTDKQRLLNEIEWLNQQLKEKSIQILELRENSNQKVYLLESKVEDASAENNNLKTLNETLTKANQDMENQIEELSRKLQEVREKSAQTQLDYEEESKSREKLIELYREESASSREKLETAATVINDLKQMLTEMKEEYGKLADEKKANELAFESKLNEKDEHINKLEQELKNANELLSIAKRKGATVLSESDIETLSPAAAVASRLLKSGMTLTQIYSEYVNLTETLQNEKNENERLRSYLTEVIKEIEEKAPILRKQKQEYEEAMKTIDSLTSQLENALMDYEVLKSKSEDSIKKYNAIASENVLLKQDVNDLSRHVTVLLAEVEKMRSKMIGLTQKAIKMDVESIGNQSNLDVSAFSASILYRASREDDEGNETNAEVSSTSEFISNTPYKNIEELQKQNQHLKRILNEKDKQKQSEEKLELELRTKEFNEKLNMALRELEEFKTQREKQEQVLEEIRKQRDTYKQLLNSYQSRDSNAQFLTSTPGFKFAGGSNIMGSPEHETTGVSSSASEKQSAAAKSEQQRENQELLQKLSETSRSLEKLQVKFDHYQEEMNTLHKTLSQEVEDYRSKSSDLGLKLALSESKLESSIEKCKTLNTALEKSRKELDTFKERNSKFNELIIKHEQSISLTTNELNRAKERVNDLEIKLHTISVERDLLKSNQERLTKEHELLIRENNSRSMILSNLEVIRNSCERNERENKLMFTQKIEQLEKENLIQRKQIENDQEQHQTIIKSWQAQNDRLVEQHEKLNAEYEKTRDELRETKTTLEALQEKHRELEAKQHSNEMILQMTRNSKSSSAISHLTQMEEEIKDLQSKLSIADKEIVSLKIQLEDSRSHSKQYKYIADTMEKTMKETTESAEKTKQLLEQQLESLTAQLGQANVKCAELSESQERKDRQFVEERANLERVQASLSEEKAKLNNELAELRRRLEYTESILEERTNDRESLGARLSILEEQFKEQTDKLVSVENELTAKQAENSELVSKLNASEEAGQQEAKQRNDLRESFEQKESNMATENQALKNENENLMKQIDTLQQELTAMGQNLIVLQKQDAFKLPSSFMTASASITSEMETSEGAAKASESQMDDSNVTSTSSINLLEINRFLRTQKEQTEEKYETLKLSYELAQQRLKNIENDLEFYHKQAQLQEAEIVKLKSSAGMARSSSQAADTSMNQSFTENVVNSENLNLIVETNKRLKAEIDMLSSENTKLYADLKGVEDEMANVKARANASELEKQSILGENTCIKTEIKRWKDRVDALMRSSDREQEWLKIQNEVQEAQEKNQMLADTISGLRKSLSEANGKLESLAKELELVRAQSASAQNRLNQELETLRTDKKSREEMFKALVNALRDVVTTVQKELQLKEVDWMKGGHQQERLQNIREECLNMKKVITEKLKAERDEFKVKVKQAEDAIVELQNAQKRLEEADAKNKASETKIGQMTNFINSNRTRLANLTKKIEDLTKEKEDAVKKNDELTAELNEAKASSGHAASGQTASDSQTKSELDQLKKKFLQSQIENNRLKTELAEQKKTPAASSSTSTATPTAAASASAPANTSAASTSSEPNQQQQPPTAYITPSRIASTTSTIQSQPSSSVVLRRTAAVQPTPHESSQPQGVAQGAQQGAGSGQAMMGRQQQILARFNESNQWQTSQTAFSNVQPSTSSETAQFVSEEPQQQGNFGASSSTFMHKRTREEDQSEDVNSASTASNPFAAVSSKKAKSNTGGGDQATTSSAADNASSSYANPQIATIEPFTSNEQSGVNEGENSDFVIIGDEMHGNEPDQDTQESGAPEEIILDDENSPESYGMMLSQSEYSSAHQQESHARGENLQQNVLSSTSENQMMMGGEEEASNTANQDSSESQTNQNTNDEESQDDQDVIEEDTGSDIDNDVIAQEEDNDVISDNDNQQVEQDDEVTEERFGEEDDGATNNNQTEGQTEDDRSENPNAEYQREGEHHHDPSTADNQGQASYFGDNAGAGEEARSSQVTTPKPTETSVRSQQQQQQQPEGGSSSIIRLNTSSQSRMPAGMFQSQPQQHQQQPPTQQEPPKREVPKPIVWDAGSTSSQTSTTTTTTTQGNPRLRRMQPQAGQAAAAQMTTTPNYFQQEMQMQQLQQANAFQGQTSQFRLQASQFQLQNQPQQNPFAQLTTEQQSGNIQLANQQRNLQRQLIRGRPQQLQQAQQMQLLQQQAQQQQQQMMNQPRVINTLNARGGLVGSAPTIIGLNPAANQGNLQQGGGQMGGQGRGMGGMNRGGGNASNRGGRPGGF